jgi:hypothetical protein
MITGDACAHFKWNREKASLKFVGGYATLIGYFNLF